VLSEIESGFRTVHLKLEASESKSVARAEKTQGRIQVRFVFVRWLLVIWAECA
jgi:ppGpp synthetase/RelA/SpoT-type nucleotidyltranferase